MPENPKAIDFTALKKARDEALKTSVQEMCTKYGWDISKITLHISHSGCYCACPTGGPCEHHFTGWREHEDGLGGEQVCSLCGMGAMAHSMRIDW